MSLRVYANESEGDADLGTGAGSALPSSVLISCGVAVAFATTMSLFSIFLHLKNYRKPLLQRMVVRILIMVPIYGISSLIAIFSLEAAFVIDAIRDVYEAFVIYCFFNLLLAYLGGERSLLILLHGRPLKAPVFPLNIFWHEIDVSDPYTFLFLKRGILQYVQIKPLLAIATLLLKSFGIYNEGNFRANSGYLYVTIIYNFSIFLSLYCLAMFWVCVHDDLLPFRPMPKFLCIKGIIFFSFWQSAFISLLVAVHAINQLGPYTDSEHISLALTDTLICFEMVFFALLHQYAFSHTDYIDPRSTYCARMAMGYAFRDAFGLQDVVEDTRATFAGEGMDYKEFEPAEGYMHQGIGRDRRIQAGLRYAQGGKKKYWLPMPAQETEPDNIVNRIGHHLKRNESEVFYAPLMRDQADQVIHNGPDMQGSDDDEDYPVNAAIQHSDQYSLNFSSPNNSDENLFETSRHYLFGDYNYPVIDVSAESARQAMWDEEERILHNQRGAFFSPRHQERRLYFAQRDYGTTQPSVSQTEHSKSKGKNRRVEDLDNTRGLTINREDDRLPDLMADGVKLHWTAHGNLRPSGSTSSSAKDHSSSPPKRVKPKPKDAEPVDEGYASSPYSSSPSGSGGSSPATRKRSISKAKQSTDAVDLVVEDPKAAEASMTRERMRGEPAVRGSGLRKVFKRQYVIEDEDGEVEKEVEIEERIDPVEEQREGEDRVADETDIKIKSPTPAVQSPAEEQPVAAEEITDVQVVRAQSPPPFARVEVDKYLQIEDGTEQHNPWS